MVLLLRKAYTPARHEFEYSKRAEDSHYCSPEGIEEQRGKASGGRENTSLTDQAHNWSLLTRIGELKVHKSGL